MIDEFDFEDNEDFYADEPQSEDWDDRSVTETDDSEDTDLISTAKNCDETDIINHAMNDDTSVVNSHLDQTAFVGGGWDCTCYGSCLCRYYMPKGVYDEDCRFCGHHKSDHKPR